MNNCQDLSEINIFIEIQITKCDEKSECYYYLKTKTVMQIMFEYKWCKINLIIILYYHLNIHLELYVVIITIYNYILICKVTCYIILNSWILYISSIYKLPYLIYFKTLIKGAVAQPHETQRQGNVDDSSAYFIAYLSRMAFPFDGLR